VAGGAAIARRTAHAGRYAECVDSYDGVGRVRPGDCRSRPTRLRGDARRTLVQAIVVIQRPVTCFVVFIQRRAAGSTDDCHIRTRHSGQQSKAYLGGGVIAPAPPPFNRP